jgi:surface antigen
MRVASLRLASCIALAMLPVLITACSSDNRLFSRRYGSSATASAGSVIGGIANSVIGGRMDERERSIAANAEYWALQHGESGKPTFWDNRITRHHGSIVPGPAYNLDTEYCRNYTHTVYWDTSPMVTKGTACRESKGIWRRVDCFTSTHTIYRHGFPVTAKVTNCRGPNGPGAA